MNNRSPNRRIFVSYEEYVRHVNTTRPDEKIVKMISIEPGRPEVLGCARTKGLLSEQYDLWSYTILSACFADQCPSSMPQKPGRDRDPRMTCEALCEQDDPSCLKQELKGGSPADDAMIREIKRFSDSILTAKLPARIDTGALVAMSALYTGTNDCRRSDLEIAASTGGVSPQFTNSGSDCRIGFPVTNPEVTNVEITLPGQWRGGANIASPEYVFSSEDEPHSPRLGVTRNGQREFDWIAFVKGVKEPSSARITFTGTKYYCAQLRWKGD